MCSPDAQRNDTETDFVSTRIYSKLCMIHSNPQCVMKHTITLRAVYAGPSTFTVSASNSVQNPSFTRKGQKARFRQLRLAHAFLEIGANLFSPVATLKCQNTRFRELRPKRPKAHTFLEFDAN